MLCHQIYQNGIYKVKGLSVLCNPVVVHLIYLYPPFYVLERTKYTGKWMCVLSINFYMLLVWLSISLSIIVQLKNEDIRIPQNTCALKIPCFWMMHINVWFFLLVLFGTVLIASYFFLFSDGRSSVLWSFSIIPLIIIIMNALFDIAFSLNFWLWMMYQLILTIIDICSNIGVHSWYQYISGL